MNKRLHHQTPALSTDHPQEFPLWKRRLDLACVALSLPFCLPLMFLIALSIKLASKGPVFYRQERIGLKGRRFVCLKFRTMRVNAGTEVHEDYLVNLMKSDTPMTKLDSAGDQRVIPLGRLLRASGLDELPQIINVLRGDMSLVGPRPCTPNELESYEQGQTRRLQAPPGLTGYWQVNGKNRTTFREMITLDIWYAHHMSLWLDLKIMLRTPKAIFDQIFDGTHASQSPQGERERLA